jgi:hypothetical protein
MDWHSNNPPDEESIAGAQCLDQGQIHLNSISVTGGPILGARDLALEGISPWLFRGAHFHVNSRVHRGLTPIRPQTMEDQNLPVLTAWGLRVACIIAEKHFGVQKALSASSTKLGKQR